MSFTTPVLTGARVRPADRTGLELLMNNPAGGRGTYVLPWNNLASLCRPTVHDRQLTECIAALRIVTPASIRQAARQVASAGLAGRAAGALAQAGIDAERKSLVLTNFHLLLRLVQQEEPAGHGAGPAEAAAPAELERRARKTIAAIAPRLGLDAETIGSHLEQLAGLIDPVGLSNQGPQARLPHAVSLLKLLRQEVSSYPTEADKSLPSLIAMIVAAADLTIAAASQALTETRGSLGHITRLIQAWQSDAVTLSRRLSRAEWLLDGWERICQLWWLDREPAAQRDALDEIAQLVPVIPREVRGWVGFHLELEPALQLRRMVVKHEDWRTGVSVFDLVARNEAMVAV